MSLYSHQYIKQEQPSSVTIQRSQTKGKCQKKKQKAKNGIDKGSVKKNGIDKGSVKKIKKARKREGKQGKRMKEK